jgi:hypothetical protein
LFCMDAFKSSLSLKSFWIVSNWADLYDVILFIWSVVCVGKCRIYYFYVCLCFLIGNQQHDLSLSIAFRYMTGCRCLYNGLHRIMGKLLSTYLHPWSRADVVSAQSRALVTASCDEGDGVTLYE